MLHLPLTGLEIVRVNASITPPLAFVPKADTHLPGSTADALAVPLVAYVVAEVVVTVVEGGAAGSVDVVTVVAAGGTAAPVVATVVWVVPVTGYGAVVLVVPPGRRGIPLLEGRELVDGRAAAYVCRNLVCDRPVTDPEELTA